MAVCSVLSCSGLSRLGFFFTAQFGARPGVKSGLWGFFSAPPIAGLGCPVALLQWVPIKPDGQVAATHTVLNNPNPCLGQQSGLPIVSHQQLTPTYLGVHRGPPPSTTVLSSLGLGTWGSANVCYRGSTNRFVTTAHQQSANWAWARGSSVTTGLTPANSTMGPASTLGCLGMGTNVQVAPELP